MCSDSLTYSSSSYTAIGSLPEGTVLIQPDSFELSTDSVVRCEGTLYYSSYPSAEEIIGGTLSKAKRKEDKTLRNKYEDDPSFSIKKIKEIVPNRVFEFTLKGRGYFNEERIIKTVCDSEDEPNLEYACALAIAKYYYNLYTLEAIINHIIPFHVFGEKNNLKEVKHGVKIIEENRRIALLEKEKEETKARQKKKRAEQKRRRAEKRKNDQIDIIKEAILASKNEG